VGCGAMSRNPDPDVLNGVRPRTSLSLPVLMYHDVSQRSCSSSMKRFVVSPNLFEEHMSALVESGYQATQLSRLGETSPDPMTRTAFITFDDGFRDVIENALPVLIGLHLSATFFVPSAYVGCRAEWLPDRDDRKRPLAGWGEFRAAGAYGFEVGSHGHRHLELDVLRPMAMSDDLKRSKNIIEAEIGSQAMSLAYPFGYHNQDVRTAASRLGFRFACETGYGLHRLSGDPMRIRRILVGPDTSPDHLLALMRTDQPTNAQRLRRNTRGVWRQIRRIRGAVGSGR